MTVHALTTQPNPDQIRQIKIHLAAALRLAVHDGFEEGMDIPIYYDPMIAKLIVHAANREQAIERMTRAIAEYKISGVQTTLEFCSWAINHEAFKSGNFDTHFVKNHFSPEMLIKEDSEEMEIAAFLAVNLLQEKSFPVSSDQNSGAGSAWKNNRLR